MIPKTAQMVPVVGTDKSLGNPQIVSLGKTPPRGENITKEKKEKRGLA